MLSPIAARNAAAPWTRNASQSLSARNGREYSSVRSTAFRPSSACSMYASSCANARSSAARSRTSTTPHAFGRYSHLWASTDTESARSSPAKSGRPWQVAAAAGRP